MASVVSSDIPSSGENVVGTKNTDLALRVAMFTAAAHAFLGILFIAGFQVYIIVQEVVQPMMWAVLTGTFLFPFKSFLAALVKAWLHSVKETSTGLVVAIALTPFVVLDKSLDYIGAQIVDFAREHGKKGLYLLAVSMTIFFIYYWMAPYVNFFIWLGLWILGYSWEITEYLTASKLAVLIIAPYAAALHFFWNTEHHNTLLYSAIPIWILIGYYVLHFLGPLAMPLYLFFAFTHALGYYTRRKASGIPFFCLMTAAERAMDRVYPGNLTSGLFTVTRYRRKSSTPKVEAIENKEAANGVAGVDSSSKELDLRSQLKDLVSDDGEIGEGTQYLIYVFRAFFLVEALMSYYVIPLILFPVLYRAVKIFIQQQQLGKRLKRVFKPWKDLFDEWASERSQVVAPSLFKTILADAKTGDRRCLAYIESLTDETVSACLIVLMFLFAAIGGVIAVLQVEKETSYLVAVTGTMFDETVRNNPELYSWLPDTDEFKEYIDAGYIYGRDFALKTVRSTIGDANETRAEEIETELIAIADRFYNHYVQKNVSVPVTLADANKGLGSLLGGVNLNDPLSFFGGGEENGTNPFASIWSSKSNGSTNQLSVAGVTSAFTAVTKYLDINAIKAFMQQHIETFMSVFDSAWTIVKDNVSILSTFVWTIVSMIANYFSAFLEFILCSVVYLTALFSLLSSSGRRYRPIEFICSASEYFSGAEAFAAIVEDTVSGIFAVSLKMGTFYGLYTWVLMSFCGVYVRFIPSVFAALFAMIPLVPTYAVSLPAVVNLLIRGDYITCAILAVGAYLPTLIVDDAIYGELKTANPMLFGLSVGGGLVTMGIEGAVIGPMLLCFFIIVIETVKMVIESRFSKEKAIVIPEF